MQKILSVVLVLLLVTGTNSCDVLEQVGETERFVQCDFSLNGVRVVEMGGIDLRNVNSASDLGLGDMMSLSQRFINGNLPATLEVDVNARNSSTKVAGIAGMAWKVFLDESEFVGGQFNQSIQVFANSSTNFPIRVQVDLIKMLQSESLPKILNLIFGMKDNTKLRELGLSVKLKPAYKTSSGAVIEFPLWITIRP